MSIYVKCPTCGAIIADKELAFIEFKEKLDQENIKENERQERIKNFLDSLHFNNYCCWIRIYTACDYSKIII